MDCPLCVCSKNTVYPFCAITKGSKLALKLLYGRTSASSFENFPTCTRTRCYFKSVGCCDRVEGFPRSCNNNRCVNWHLTIQPFYLIIIHSNTAATHIPANGARFVVAMNRISRPPCSAGIQTEPSVAKWIARVPPWNVLLVVRSVHNFAHNLKSALRC